MTIVRKIKPVWKNGYHMTHIAMSKTWSEHRKWKRRYYHNWTVIFGGSPRKDEKGYYSLLSK